MIQYSSINDAWGNKDINKKTINNIEKFIEKPSNQEKTNISPQIISPQIISPPMISPQIISPPMINKEHFTSDVSYCSFTEHLKTCEKCKKNMAEYFTNPGNNTREINLFGLIKFNLTTDVLNLIFIILIILIFVIILSMVNVSFRTNNTAMKYYMVPSNLANIPVQYFGN